MALPSRSQTGWTVDPVARKADTDLPYDRKQVH